MAGILKYFPTGKVPRDGQGYALEQIQEVLPWADVIVVRAPTATGKTDIGVTAAKWASASLNLKSHTIVPTKQLVDQLVKSYPRMPVLRASGAYPCARPEREVGPRGGVTETRCGRCPPCKRRVRDNRKIRVTPYGASNYHVYYSYKLYKPLLFVDEAHKLLDLLRDMGATRFAQRDYGFPSDIRTYGEVLGWAERELAHRPTRKVELLVSELRSLQPSTTLQVTREMYRRRMDTVLKLLPLDVRHLPPWFWPSKVRKIVLMSATIGPQDIEDMGLGNRKVAYVDCDSPIPATNRPVFYTPVADMRLAAHEDSIPEVVKRVGVLAHKFQGSKGLVHATYRVAQGLRESPLGSDPRFIWHTPADKADRFEEFQQSTDKILVASGMQEGIDLPYDACRWQVITQVPWPSLEDPATRERLKQDPTWYLWQCTKTIMQACGRVCRTPDDYGCTYLLDSQGERWLRAAKQAKLLPKWYTEAII